MSPCIVAPPLTGAALRSGVGIVASRELGPKQFGWDRRPREACGREGRSARRPGKHGKFGV